LNLNFFIKILGNESTSKYHAEIIQITEKSMLSNTDMRHTGSHVQSHEKLHMETADLISSDLVSAHSWVGFHRAT